MKFKIVLKCRQNTQLVLFQMPLRRLLLTQITNALDLVMFWSTDRESKLNLRKNNEPQG